MLYSLAILRSLPARLAVALLLATTSFGYAQEGNVVARVDGHEITQADVAVAEEMFATQLGDMPADAKLSVIVDALIELRLLAEAARGAGVTDNDAYKREIGFLESQTLRSFYVDEQVAAAVTDDAVRAIYDQQVGSIPKVVEHRLRHILVASEEEAREIIAALEAGEPFAELAEARSLDAVSKAGGGDLGFLAAGQMIPEIEEALSALQPGEFAREPIQTAFGYHVILLEESRDRPPPPFESVAAQIRQQLEAASERRLIADLRTKADVQKLVPDVAPPQEDDGHDH